MIGNNIGQEGFNSLLDQVNKLSLIHYLCLNLRYNHIDLEQGMAQKLIKTINSLKKLKKLQINLKYNNISQEVLKMLQKNFNYLTSTEKIQIQFE